MQLNLNDWIGFAGVAILLVAFLFNLLGKLSREGWVYSVLNIVGAGLACLASALIHYGPFVLLEAVWTVVSLAALVNYISKRKETTPE